MWALWWCCGFGSGIGGGRGGGGIGYGHCGVAGIGKNLLHKIPFYIYSIDIN